MKLFLSLAWTCTLLAAVAPRDRYAASSTPNHVVSARNEIISRPFGRPLASWSDNSEDLLNDATGTKPLDRSSSSDKKEKSLHTASYFNADMLESAYDGWRAKYSKNFNPTGFKTFKSNYLTIMNANIAAEQKALEAGKGSPEWITLNEYGDLSLDEYKVVQRELVEAKGDTLPAWMNQGPEIVDKQNDGRWDPIRRIYSDWCKQYGKEQDESRYPNFSTNFLALAQHCSNSGTEVDLNEYADCTQQEHSKLTGGDPEEIDFRSLYDEWCEAYGKEPDEGRFAVFVENYARIEAWAEETGEEITLNEFADCTKEDYLRLSTERKAAADKPTKNLDEEKARLQAETEEKADEAQKLADQKEKEAEESARLQAKKAVAEEEAKKLAEQQAKVAEERVRLQAEAEKKAAVEKEAKKLAEQKAKEVEQTARLEAEAEKKTAEAKKLAEQQAKEAEQTARLQAEAEKKTAEAKKLAEQKALEAEKETQIQAEAEKKAAEAKKLAEQQAKEAEQMARLQAEKKTAEAKKLAKQKAKDAEEETHIQAETEKKAAEAKKLAEHEAKEAEQRARLQAETERKAAAEKEAKRLAEKKTKEAELIAQLQAEAEKTAAAKKEAQQHADQNAKEAEQRARLQVEAEKKAAEANKLAKQKTKDAEGRARLQAEAEKKAAAEKEAKQLADQEAEEAEQIARLQAEAEKEAK